MFGDRATVGDISEDYAEAVTKHGVEFIECDLLRSIPQRGCYDVVVLCEVVEHLPVPLHSIIQKLSLLLNPGGHLFLTTPNLYRLRNLVRMMLGKQIFCNWFYPSPGQSLGHVLEYSREHLVWQMAQGGLRDIQCEVTQLISKGHSLFSTMNRQLAVPLFRLRPIWQDNLVAWGRKQHENDESTH